MNRQNKMTTKLITLTMKMTLECVAECDADITRATQEFNDRDMDVTDVTITRDFMGETPLPGGTWKFTLTYTTDDLSDMRWWHVEEIKRVLNELTDCHTMARTLKEV